MIIDVVKLAVMFIAGLIQVLAPDFLWNLKFYFSDSFGDAPPLFVVIIRITGSLFMIISVALFVKIIVLA